MALKIMDKDELAKSYEWQIKYRTVADGYEYLARLAANAGHNSIKKIIDQRIFRKGWHQELFFLRSLHAKMGIKSEDFYHPGIRKLMGLKEQKGRKKRRRLKAVPA